MAYSDAAFFKINLRPRETEQLALAQTGEQADGKRVSERAVLNRFKEFRNIFIAERCYFALYNLRLLGGVAGIGYTMMPCFSATESAL